ncbi:MAG: hypothetical protein K8L97_19565 [Anaerolineae bacterium]|nr:hypothetical protein [Anaerolineae bacterium]
MIEVNIKFQVDGVEVLPTDVQDEYLAEMLEYTGEQIRQQVHAKLDAVRCPEHGSAPRVTVTAQYATDVDQMELGYHVDSCCQQLLLRAVQALNNK